MSWPRLQQRLSLRCSDEGARVVARVKARLQLSDPIPARGEYQVRIGLQVLLELALIELRIVEGGEARGQASESQDEPELSDDNVDDVTKLGLSCEFESVFGLALYIDKRISGGQKKCDQTVAGIDRIFEVAGFLHHSAGSRRPQICGLFLRPSGHIY